VTDSEKREQKARDALDVALSLFSGSLEDAERLEAACLAWLAAYRERKAQGDGDL
jgi:hypothetical protein